MPSFAGIVACGCCKIQPMNGANWNRNWFRSMPRTPRQDSKSPRFGESEIQSKDAEQPLQGIEVTVHHALFERNDRVLGNRDRLRTYLPATSGDVAVTDVVLVPQIADPVFGVERMHFECSGINEQTRTDKFVVLVVFPQDVAHVLTEKALDALAKLLHALDVGLLDAPCAIGCVGWAGLELLDRLLGPEIPRDIRDQIAYDRKRMHRLNDDRHIQIDVTEPGHAHEPGHAVDFGRARSTLAGLAVPSHREVGCLLRLNAVHRVQNNHALLDGCCVILECAARGVSAPDAKCRWCGHLFRLPATSSLQLLSSTHPASA